MSEHTQRDELERVLKGLLMTPENRDDYGDNHAAYCQVIFDKPGLLLELIDENKQLQEQLKNAERDVKREIEARLSAVCEAVSICAERNELAAKVREMDGRRPVPPENINPEKWLEGAKGDGWVSGNIAPTANGDYERFFLDGAYIHQFFDGVWHSKSYGNSANKPHWRQVGDYPCWRSVPATQSVDGMVDALLSGAK